MNSELCKQALTKVGNSNTLINLVSRRVRQLTSGGGGALGRPLIAETVGLGAADIAMKEIVEGKIGWDMPDEATLMEANPRKRKKH